jgi:hypothetical protein
MIVGWLRPSWSDRKTVQLRLYLSREDVMGRHQMPLDHRLQQAADCLRMTPDVVGDPGYMPLDRPVPRNKVCAEVGR